MARLRRRIGLAKENTIYQRPSQAVLGHSEPESPEDPSPSSPSDRSKSFATFFALWPDKSSLITNAPIDVATDTTYNSTDVAQYQLLCQSLTSPLSEQFPRRASSPRRPRHVPIIIPDFANPYTPELSLQGASNTSIAWAAALRQRTKLALLSEKEWKVPQYLNPAPTSLHAAQQDSKPAKMNSSQVSLSASESGADGGPGPQVVSPAAAVGIPSAAIQQNAAPTTLSGLVCNVHRTTGQEPHALVGATTTILGDKLYVFGGRIHSKTKPQLTSDLFELDLIRRHWTKLDPFGDIPPPRYFHSVCALGDSKLVCYGGMSPSAQIRSPSSSKSSQEPQPEVVVMSDIHVFDVPSKTWTRVPTSQGPEGRYAHCAAILPSSAVFTSANAPLSAIHHNPSSQDPHSGKLGVELDGAGGAEMVVVGGQDSANNYIEEISVFNLRSLRWTTTTPYDRKCGAYKSMVAPMTGMSADLLGQGIALDDPQARQSGTPMLIYSNYNFLDVKLELQIRLPNGTLKEKQMNGPVSPPGLRFPNGGIIDNHFVVSGTYLTSSKHEYALWALDLRSLTWGRIDTNGTVFGHGSWNRGVLWNRRNTFVILGHRKRSLVDDYNHRRINFSHICMVELEAFGLYENPRKKTPTSGYVSVSTPAVPKSMQSHLTSRTAGGRPYTAAAEQLGLAALNIPELCDMDIVALGREKVPCNFHVLSRRWGPYFNMLLRETATMSDGATMSDAATLRPGMRSQASRNSTVTITPGTNRGTPSFVSTLNESTTSQSTIQTLVEIPDTVAVPAASRPRSLYLPHTVQTIQLMLHFLYTSSLPPVGASLCTPHILCSLLQMARPYQIDGLLEATVERLHEVLDGRNAAAVFNAAAMAAGGGRGLGIGTGGTLEALVRRDSMATTLGDGASLKVGGLRIATDIDNTIASRKTHLKGDSVDSASTTTSTDTSTELSHTDTESTHDSGSHSKKEREIREVWTGDVSSVIGLQKRGLRGLMEGRRLRERANTNTE